MDLFKTVNVWDELGRLTPEEVSGRSLAVYLPEEDCYLLRVIDLDYLVSLERRCVERRVGNGVEKAPWQLQILLPIYLVNARGGGLEGAVISPLELDGGNLFFASKAHNLSFNGLLKRFRSPRDFLEAGTSLGGERASYGNASFKFNVLPLIPLYYVYHAGGGEFQNRITVFFDSSAKKHLPTDSLWLTIEYSKRRLQEAPSGE